MPMDIEPQQNEDEVIYDLTSPEVNMEAILLARQEDLWDLQAEGRVGRTSKASFVVGRLVEVDFEVCSDQNSNTQI